MTTTDSYSPTADGSTKVFGMENFGNTCYCNSVLQCLYYSKPFRERVLAFGSSKRPTNRRRRTSVKGLKPHPFTLGNAELLRTGADPSGNGTQNANNGSGSGSSANNINGNINYSTSNNTNNNTQWPGPDQYRGNQVGQMGTSLPTEKFELGKFSRKMSIFKRDSSNSDGGNLTTHSTSSGSTLVENNNWTNAQWTFANNISNSGNNNNNNSNNNSSNSDGGAMAGSNSNSVNVGPAITGSQAQKYLSDSSRPALRGLQIGTFYPGQNAPVVGFNDDPFCTPEARKRAALLKGPIINLDLSMSDEYGMKESLFTALKDVFESMAENSSRTGVVSPQKLIDVLKRENELFRSSMHQDAHEFLNFLLNEVIESVDRATSAATPAAPAAGSGTSTGANAAGDSSRESPVLSGSASSLSWGSDATLRSQSSHWVHELFEGLLTSETKCLTCETVSRRDEQFLDLSIDLERNTSITSCLKQFSASEMLCERNKFHCDTCGGLQEAEKRMKLKKLPKILALHLKRFKFTEDMQRNVKLFHRVMYPSHLRLVNTTFDAEDPDKLYELCSVVVHIGGGPYHGHYVSVVKTEHMGWLMFDDEMVEAVDSDYVFNFFGNNRGMATAYVLFYQEVSEQQLSPDMLNDVVDVFGENLSTTNSMAQSVPSMPSMPSFPSIAGQPSSTPAATPMASGVSAAAAAAAAATTVSSSAGSLAGSPLLSPVAPFVADSVPDEPMGLSSWPRSTELFRNHTHELEHQSIDSREGVPHRSNSTVTRTLGRRFSKIRNGSESSSTTSRSRFSFSFKKRE